MAVPALVGVGVAGVRVMEEDRGLLAGVGGQVPDEIRLQAAAVGVRLAGDEENIAMPRRRRSRGAVGDPFVLRPFVLRAAEAVETIDVDGNRLARGGGGDLSEVGRA